MVSATLTTKNKKMDKQKIISVLEDLVYEDINQEHHWKAVKEAKLLIKELKQALTIPAVVDTLPADELIKSLGEATETNEYILKPHNGVWWIEHKHVGSGEPLSQWLTDKPISG